MQTLHVFMPDDVNEKTLRNMIYWRCDEGNWTAKSAGDKEFVIAVYSKEEFEALEKK